MGEIASGVAVFEVIGNNARLTVRYHTETKGRDELIFPPDTTLTFKEGVLSADKDQIIPEDANEARS